MRFLFAAAGFVLVVAACDNLTVVSQPEGGPRLKMLSLVEGAYLSASEPIEFQLGAPLDFSAALALSILLADPDGTIVWQTSLPGPPLNEVIELAALDPLNLQTGEYVLRFILSSEEFDDRIREVPFFLVTGYYAVDGIRSFPPVARTTGSTLLAADVSFPEGGDPYFVWAEGGTVFAEGHLSAGAGQVLWRAPDVPGINTVVLSLFPVAPETTMNFSLLAPASMAATLHVYDRASSVADVERYFSLLLLDGDLREADPNHTGTAPAVSGTLVPTAIGEDLGVAIDPDVEVKFARSLVPLVRTSPAFTLLVDVLRSDVDDGGHLLRLEADDGQPVLALGLTEAGAVTLTTLASEDPFVSSQYRLPPGRVVQLGLSMVQRSEVWDAALYAGGEQIGAISGALETTAVGLVTVFGGPGSFVGVLGQLATYHRDSAGTPGAYPFFLREAVLAHTGREPELALGFDSGTLPDAVTVDGEAHIRSGQLVLTPGAAINLPALTSPDGTLSWRIAAGQPDRITVTILQADGTTVLVDLSGAKAPDESIATFLSVPVATQPGRPADVLISWSGSSDAQRLQLAAGDAAVSVDLPQLIGDLDVELLQPDTSTQEVVIDSVVAVPFRRASQ